MNNDIRSLVAAIMLGCVGVFAIMAGPILTEALVGGLGLPPKSAGQVFAVEALGTALGPVAAAFWMPRVSWRLAGIVALLVVVGGDVLSSYQSGVRALLGLRFLVGFLGQGTAFALGIAIVSATAEKDRNFAYLIAAQVILGVVMFLVLPMPKGAGVPGVFLPLAVFAAAALLTVGWIPQPQGAGGGHGTAAAAGGSAMGGVIALVVMLIWCTGLGAIWAFVKLIGKSAGIEPAQVGVALAISTGVATLGALAASVIKDRFGRILPVTVALLVQVAMIALLRGQMSFLQFAVTAATFQVFWNMTGPYLMGTVAMSDATGRISVLIPTAQIGGFFLGPVIAGPLLTPGEGYGPANTVAIACLLLALAIFVPTASRLTGRAPAGH